MKRNIILFKGALEVLDYFTDECADAFKKLGADVFVADASKLNDMIYGRKFNEFASREHTAVYIFNQFGLNLMAGGYNYWDEKGINVYDHVQDHPRNYDDALLCPIKRLHVLSLDRNHISFIRKFYPKVSSVRFLPNGGAAEGEMIPFEQRPIDVLYCGSCQQEVPAFLPLPFLPDNGAEMYRTVISKMLKNPDLTTEKALSEYTSDTEILYDLNMSAALYIETYVRRYFKLQALHALADAGIHVEVYGDNWGNDSDYNGFVHIHERVSSAECNRLAARSKICLNFMPWFKDGASERVFNNMLAGSLCVSDPSFYLTEHYTDCKEIVYFDLKRMMDLPLRVKYYLDHPSEAAAIAEAGRGKAIAEDTWLERMRTVLSFMDEDGV